MDKRVIGEYAKAIAAAASAAGTTALIALGDGVITTPEWVTIAASFIAGLLAVWSVPEFPVSIGKYLKAITSGIIAGLGVVSTILVDGHNITQGDWINIGVAILVGSGLVHVINNSPTNTTLHVVTAPVVEELPIDIDEDAELEEPPVETADESGEVGTASAG